ncbi:hypothetical protein JW887_01390 [Candidatus Dojkabacteria bacterium]|nr:hypothetical protein [Candidatus Dojkabacteria bacterium]
MNEGIYQGVFIRIKNSDEILKVDNLKIIPTIGSKLIFDSSADTYNVTDVEYIYETDCVEKEAYLREILLTIEK